MAKEVGSRVRMSGDAKQLLDNETDNPHDTDGVIVRYNSWQNHYTVEWSNGGKNVYTYDQLQEIV